MPVSLNGDDFKQQNGLSQFMNLKRVFADAQRQNQIDTLKDQRKQFSEEQQARIGGLSKIYGTDVAAGNSTADDAASRYLSSSQLGANTSAPHQADTNTPANLATSAAVPQEMNVQSNQVNTPVQKSKGVVTDIGDAIIKGDQPPDLSRLYGKAAGVRGYLARNGFDLKKATTDWNATQAFTKNLNSTQQVRLGQAISSVKSSIEPLRELSKEFDRASWRPATKAQVFAAMTGTDPTKRNIATKYVTQINLMKDELGQAFMSGGVPTDRAFKLADDILEPAYGVSQLDSGLKQLEYNLNIREKAISSMQPRLLQDGSGSSQQQSTNESQPNSNQVGKYTYQ